MKEAPGWIRLPRRDLGFTLIETIGVLAIVAIIAVSAAPAFRSMSSMRERALHDECARLLSIARASATATGQPHGLEFDLTGQILRLVRIESSGQAPTPALGSGAAARPALVISSRFAGSTIDSLINGDGGSTRTTVWFGFSGVPEVREADGTLVGPFTSDAVITVSGPSTITVRRETGAIE